MSGKSSMKKRFFNILAMNVALLVPISKYLHRHNSKVLEHYQSEWKVASGEYQKILGGKTETDNNKKNSHSF